MLKHWKHLRTKIVHRNPWWTYKLDGFEIPGGDRGEYHYVHTHGSSMVVPVADDGRIVLVNQYRYLCRRESIELPCGSVKAGSSYLETARAELEEETGYRAGSMEAVGEFNPYNGVTTEICKVFIARDLTAGVARPDPTEELELVLSTVAELDAMIADQTIWDGMTMASWLLARGKVG